MGNTLQSITYINSKTARCYQHRTASHRYTVRTRAREQYTLHKRIVSQKTGTVQVYFLYPFLKIGVIRMDKYAIYLRKSRADLEAEKLGEGETLARHKKILTELASRKD